ncbi:hypothetical protein [Sinomonas sp. P47F7]|uniref:hypothetical protein n=1 Tax=Sinomonas sp. P47F7 TaxID=3410987 RepID=UPI003BF619B8
MKNAHARTIEAAADIFLASWLFLSKPFDDACSQTTASGSRRFVDFAPSADGNVFMALTLEGERELNVCVPVAKWGVEAETRMRRHLGYLIARVRGALDRSGDPGEWPEVGV